MTQFDLPAAVTQAQVDAWKQQHGRVHIIRVDFDGAPLCAIVHRPTIKVISAAASVISTDPVRAGMITYENCKLWVDPIIDSNDELKMSVASRVGELFKSYHTELGEL